MSSPVFADIPGTSDGEVLDFPEVIAFLTQTHRRYKRDRSMWDAERQQMQARIAVLEGEKVGVEQLKNDLVRRCKMLEHSLRALRVKYAEATGNPLDAAVVPTAGGSDVPAGATSSGHQQDLDASGAKVPTIRLAGSRYSKDRGEKLRRSKILRAYLNELDITASVVQAPLTASGVIATPDFTTRNVDAALDNMHAPVFARPADDEAAAGSAAPGRSATVGGPGGSAPAAAAADGRASGFADTAPAKVGLDEEHMWKQRATLRSHFDAVQTVAWYEDAPLLLTASEDCTVKLWNVGFLLEGRRSSGGSGVEADQEPIYTFRGHTGPVYALAVDARGDRFCSGGGDGVINVWDLPDSNIEPYAEYGRVSAQRVATLRNHTDNVWDLAFHSASGMLLSAGADGSALIFDLADTKRAPVALVHGDVIPTACAWEDNDPNSAYIAYRDSSVVLFDVGTQNEIKVLRDATMGAAVPPQTSQVNDIICHPLQPLVITAHEDKNIRFFDPRSGDLVQTVVAHTAGVGSISLDASGLFLASGGHDCSLRLWDLRKVSDTCRLQQEMSTHRPKWEEGIRSVAIHPRFPLLATGGADSGVKVYT